MRDFTSYANHITLTVLISVLLIGSWIAGQTSRAGGDTDTILIATFMLLIPCALAALYLQTRAEEEEG
ncbi:hypothetical protein [Litorimonas sp. WD9-15]|uniref:hypothetical protein n=1 Tax=Litorimonas sp. WD9-15 TaxID=3418716 RepID=UPI003D05B717